MGEHLFLISGLLVGFFYAVAVSLDKHWVMTEIEDTVLVAIFPYLLSVLVFTPLLFTDLVSVPPLSHLLLAGGMGAVFFVPICLYYLALSYEDAAVVSTVSRLISVFTVVFSAVLISQVLDEVTYIGITLVFIGASIIAVDRDDLAKLTVSKGVVIALAASVAYGLANVGFELVLDTIEMWNYVYWSRVLPAFPAAAFLLYRKKSRHYLRTMFSESRVGMKRLTVSKLFQLSGLILYVFAASKGPVGIVSTLSGVEPLFILVGIAAWDRYTGKKRQLPTSTLVKQSVAVVLVISGVFLM